MNISWPSPISAWSCSDYTISWQNSFVDDTWVVLFVQLPSRASWTVYNYTTWYGQYSGWNYYDPYFPGWFYGVWAPYFNPLWLPISFSWRYTAVATSVNNVTIPANSIYWNLWSVTAWTTANYRFLLCTRIGTQTWTMFSLSWLIDGQLSETWFDDYAARIASIPWRTSNTTLSNTYSCDGLVKLAPDASSKTVNYSHYVQNRNGWSQTESIFNPFIDFDFTDIINDLQSACGVWGYTWAISRFSFTTTWGSWSWSTYTFPTSSFQTGWLIPWAVKYFYFAVDYTWCNTSWSAFTYTGTRDWDNIAPLSIARTVTIWECIVQTWVFNKFPISVTLPYSYGQSIPYTLQFNNANGDRKWMMILYDKIPTETYLGGSWSIVWAPWYIYYSTTWAGNLWSNPPAWNTWTMFSWDAGPNWTTWYTSWAVWIMAAIPHMNSNLFPITTWPYVWLSTFSNLNFNAVIKSTWACSLFVRNTWAYEIRQRTLSPDSFDTWLINLTTPVIGSAFDNLPAVPDEIRPIIQNVPPNNWFNPLYTLNYSVTDFLGMWTYMQTGQFMMTWLDGSFTGSLTIPLPLLNINGVSMYPSLNAVTLLRNNVPYTNYTVIPVTSWATPWNSAIVLSFTWLQTGNYQYGIKIDIPHGFFQWWTTTILLTWVNTCAPYSWKSQLTINPIQGSQILQAFKYNETPISAPNGIIQYNMNTQSLWKRYTTNTLIIDKVPTNTTFIDAQTSWITTNLQTFNCPWCRVYFYSWASIPVTPTSWFIYANFVTWINTLWVRTPPFPASQVTYVAYKIDNPNTIPPNVFPVWTGNRVGMRVQVSSGATDGLVISNEYKVISDQLLPTNSNKVETIVSTINLRDLILTKSWQSVWLDWIIGTTDDQTWSALVGKEVRYTINYISNSSSGASDAHIIDPIPANTCFKVWSLTNVFPPISHTFAYSNNGWSTYTYTPVWIYDCSVTHIRINFTQPINPWRIGKFQFDVIINNGFTWTWITNNATIFWSWTEMNMANNTWTSFLPLYRSDLYINKSVNKPITYSLDSLVYTLDYGNNGPNITTSVVITDTLPTGFIYTSSTPSGIVSGNQIIFTTWSLNVWQTGRVTINWTISWWLVSGYVLNNTVSITSLSNDSNTGNNTSSGTTIIRDRLSDVLIVKTPSILTWLTGASLNYTLQYRNLGPDTAPNVVIVDTLPTWFVYASSSPSWVLSWGKVTRWTSQIAGLTNLATWSTWTITIFWSISWWAQSWDLLTNVVTIDTSSEINTWNNISTGITLVRARMVDLVISKAVNLTGAYTWNSLTYTIQYRNLGPDNGNNVIITDTLPTWFVYTSSSPSWVLSGNIVTWTSGQIGVFGNYAPWASWTITINGTISWLAQSGDILFNEVVITNAILESNPNNNSWSASTLVKNRFADLVVIKTPSLLTWYAWSGLTYTIQYRNLGPDLGLNTVITDTLPTWFVYTSSSPSWVLSWRTITWTSGQIAWLANLVTWSTGTITIVGSISGTFNGNQRLHNTVSISGAYIDPNTWNNQWTWSTFVNPKADIRVTKAVSTGILFSWDYVSYTLSYYNSWLDTWTNITITDTWPSGLLFISASTGYNFVPTNKYVFTIPVLPVWVTGTITLTWLVLWWTSGTKIGNHVLITGNELDPLTWNNGTWVTGTIIDKYFDLELDKNLLNTGTVYVWQQVWYTITVLNKWPFTGYNITVADLLPIGISYFIHSLTQWTYDQALGIWTIGTLWYLQSATLTLTWTLMTWWVITNYAQIIWYSGWVDIDSTWWNNSGTGSNPDEDDDDKVPVTGTRPADVSITKTANQWSWHTGEIITFVLTYMNTWTGSASNVQLIDTLPTGLTYYSAFPTPLVSWSTVTRTSGQVPALWNLWPWASWFVWVNVLIASWALSGSWWTNTWRITTTSLETNTWNNVGTATVLVNQWITDLEITKTPSIQTGYAWDSVSYTIWYHNNGPDRGINTVITDILPQWFIYDYSVPAWVLSGNILTWASGEIPMFHEKFFQGDSGYITIYGSIDPSYPWNQWLHNTVSITSNIPESNTWNNQATWSVWVLPVADLVIDKSQSSDIVYSWEYILYTLSYKNGWKDTWTNVIITDHRPHNEIQFISASLPYTFSWPNYYSFVIPSIAPGEWWEIFITWLVLWVASGTQATNYAIISWNELDPDRWNNETKITTTIMTPYFDLELDKNLINSWSIYLGQNVWYTITVINQWPFTGYNITVSELLPLWINYFSHLTTQWLYDPSQGIWFIGTLWVMQTVTLTLTWTSTAAGTFVNYAQISGYNWWIDNDSTWWNNSGTGSNPDEDDDDTVSVTILNPVNLKITKDIITSPGILWKTVTWTLSYVNEWPGNATDVTITDIIPAWLSYSGSSIIWTAVALSLSWDVTYVFALWTIASWATGIITLWTTITSWYNTSYTNRASITTTALDTNSWDNSDDAVVPVISTFLWLVDPYACNSAIYWRITNTWNGVHYVTIRLLTSTGAIYKVFNPTLDTTNNFSVLIDYTNTSAINYVASGIYTIQYELKELSGKLITWSYDAFITSICPPWGGWWWPIPHCGDGIVQATIGEQCEPGQQLPNGMQCTAQCKLTWAQNYCGDGIVDTSRWEACEPSTFSMTGKSCNNQCQIIANPSEPFCGDGILQINRGEQCEVGMNLTWWWTCNASCKQVRVITNPEDPVLHHVAEHTIITWTQSNTSNTVLILPKTGADR